MNPDSNFPTVEFPNPEEGKSAFSLAIDIANKNNCHLILVCYLFIFSSVDESKWSIFRSVI